MLATFGWLTAAEGMPGWEQLRPERAWAWAWHAVLWSAAPITFLVVIVAGAACELHQETRAHLGTGCGAGGRAGRGGVGRGRVRGGGSRGSGHRRLAQRRA